MLLYLNLTQNFIDSNPLSVDKIHGNGVISLKGAMSFPSILAIELSTQKGVKSNALSNGFFCVILS